MKWILVLLALCVAGPVSAETSLQWCDRVGASRYEVGHESQSKNYDPVAAAQACAKAVTDNPDDAPSIYRLSRAYRELNRMVQFKALVQKAALMGYAPAQHDYGVSLELDGKEPQALEWYKKSADQGFGLAEHNVAEYYLFGVTVYKDIALAKEYYQKAADHLRAVDPSMSAHALNNMAFGERQEGDLTAADKHFAMAAEIYRNLMSQGDIDAYYHYGSLELQGYGIPRDVETGLAHIRYAAERGSESAQKDLPDAIAVAARFAASKANPNSSATEGPLPCEYRINAGGVANELTVGKRWDGKPCQ